jgi:death-on-curing protein
MEPVFLALEDVLDIHHDQIARYGGDASLRDLGLLEAAIAMPMQAFGGECLHEFPHGMAAAYLFHLVKNHAFVDGNKRVGLATALVFLKWNGFRLAASKAAVEALTLSVAAGETAKPAVIEFFRKHVEPACE